MEDHGPPCTSFDGVRRAQATRLGSRRWTCPRRRREATLLVSPGRHPMYVALTSISW